MRTEGEHDDKTNAEQVVLEASNVNVHSIISFSPLFTESNPQSAVTREARLFAGQGQTAGMSC